MAPAYINVRKHAHYSLRFLFRHASSTPSRENEEVTGLLMYQHLHFGMRSQLACVILVLFLFLNLVLKKYLFKLALVYVMFDHFHAKKRTINSLFLLLLLQ